MADESLEVKGPGGMGLSFKGAQMFPVILVLLLGAIFGYLFFQSDTKADERQKSTIAALNKIEEVTTRADETQQAMIYVLSLSQEERQRLNLTRPRALTAMQR